MGADQRGVRSGDFGFGHRKTRHRPSTTKRPEIPILLFGGPPVQQRMHVAFVRRLTVEHPRPVVGLSGLGLHHRHLGVGQPHTAPFRRHVRQPQVGLLSLSAHTEQHFDITAPVGLVQPFQTDLGFPRNDDVFDECANPPSQCFEFGRKREVNTHLSRSPGRQAHHSTNATH